MPKGTLKLVAELAVVGPTTVSRVLNGAVNVAPATREKILAIIRDLDYTPNLHATHLRRKGLNRESTNGSKRRSGCDNERLGAGCNACLNVSCSPETSSIFSPEEGRALAEQIIQLRRDLDTLREHTKRIQSRVDFMQQACSRRLSSSAKR